MLPSQQRDLEGTWTRVGPRKYVLVGRAHRRHPANPIELFMCGGDAAFCQITLTTVTVTAFTRKRMNCSVF